MSYIAREAFLKRIEKYSLSNGTTLGKHSGIADEIIDVLMEQPTADVVEVVRCKDCMYWTGKDYDGCCIKNGLATRYAKDYCSYGERREE